PVLAEHRISAFEGRGNADLYLLLSQGGAGKQQAAQRDKSRTAFKHRTPPLYRQFLGRPKSPGCRCRLRAVQPECVATGSPGRKLTDDWGRARNFTCCNLTGSLILHVAPRRGSRRFSNGNATMWSVRTKL